MTLKKLILAAAMFGVASAASAIPTLPNGPIYIKYDNREQISQTNSITANNGGHVEGNWGVFRVSTMSNGDLSGDPFIFDPAPGSFFQDSAAGEITGMFYGLTIVPCTTGGALCATGGFLDIYFDSTPDSTLGGALPGARCGFDCFPNYTNGTLLAHFAFASGIDPNPAIFTVGTAVPNSTGFSGLADSYANVDTGVVGAWSAQLNGNYFPTPFGQRDIRLRSIYNGPLGPWNGGGDIIGVQSSDPVRAFAIPEPTALSLLGLALVGLGFVRRRAK